MSRPVTFGHTDAQFMADIGHQQPRLYQLERVHESVEIYHFEQFDSDL